jgi:hypothetical protein
VEVETLGIVNRGPGEGVDTATTKVKTRVSNQPSLEPDTSCSSWFTLLCKGKAKPGSADVWSDIVAPLPECLSIRVLPPLLITNKHAAAQQAFSSSIAQPWPRFKGQPMRSCCDFCTCKEQRRYNGEVLCGRWANQD